MKILTKSQDSILIDWTKPYKSRVGPEQEQKHGFQEPGVVLHSFYVQLLTINLVSSVN